MIQIISPSGSLLDSPANYSTTQKAIFIKGITDDPSNLSITIENQTYTGMDIFFDGNYFTFPNPALSPDGLILYNGNNNLILNLSTTETFYLNVIQPIVNLYQPPAQPQGIYIERLAQDVLIKFQHTDSEVKYYNLYASVSSGGGINGYQKINFEPLDPISYGIGKEVLTTIADETFNANTQTADPLYAKLNFIQTDGSTNLASDVIFNSEVSEAIKRLRLTATLSAIDIQTEIVFKHNRQATQNSTPPTIQFGAFASLSNENVLYYVATAVKVVNGTEIESAYSLEVVGKPVNINQSNVSLPVVNRQTLTTEMITTIHKLQPDALVNPGSVTRDVIIDPFVNEMERTRFLLDFTYRAMSFTTLLTIDDPRNTGKSIAVSNSNYKTALGQALFFSEQNRVQAVIDSAFDKLAYNFGIKRRLGSRAIGEVVFFVKTAPTRTINIPSYTTIYAGSIPFQTTQFARISIDTLSSFYDPVKDRYAVYVPVQALNIGIAGNVTSNQIRNSSINGLSVNNENPTFGGSEVESNLDLSSRAINTLASVDTGTKSGIERIASATAGVTEVFVAGAESPYQFRGDGKVDVWIRGVSLATATDLYAPNFQTHKDSLFIPIAEGIYQFKLGDLNLSLYKMIDNQTLGYGLKNATTGEWFDLTNHTITNDNIVILDTSLTQPDYNITDVIIGDWQENISEIIYLTRQPVESISTLIDENNVEYAQGTDYLFKKTQDPLLEGYSTKAKDNILINNGAITSDFYSTSEVFSFIGFYPYQLTKKGVDALSIQLRLDSSGDGETGYTFYNSSYVANPDFIIETTDEGYTTLTRTSNSDIPENVTVKVNYSYLLNLEVTYSYNQVLQNVQSQINNSKHLTADILVKQCIPCPIDVKANIVIRKGYQVSQIDLAIRNNVQNYISYLNLGANLRVSDIVRVLDNADGVAFIDLPLTQLSFSVNTLVIREEIIPNNSYTQIVSLTTGVAVAWLIDVNLAQPASTDGGEIGRVYGNGLEFNLVSQSLITTLGNKPNSVCIIGNTDLVIGGNPITNSKNKILVALPIGKSPSDYTFHVNYQTADGSGFVNNLSLNPFSYFTVGNLNFTYRAE
jgi:uncharacterized phage protein gp47/JayE